MCLGEADSETSPKGVNERKHITTFCMDVGKLIELMHTTMVQEQVKTMKIQGGNNFKTRRTQKTTSAVEALWKTILRCYLYLLGKFKAYVRSGDKGKFPHSPAACLKEKTRAQVTLDVLKNLDS
ncbi:hypothetical protein Tco_0712406 [Tanacetum coccineum]